MGNMVHVVMCYRLNKEHNKQIRKKKKKRIYVVIYMGNVISKMCQVLSQPIRYYEKKKVEKIYKEVFQDDVWSSDIHDVEASI